MDSGCSYLGCIGVIFGGIVGLVVSTFAGLFYLSIFTGPAGAIFGGCIGGWFCDKVDGVNGAIEKSVGLVVGGVVGGIVVWIIVCTVFWGATLLSLI